MKAGARPAGPSRRRFSLLATATAFALAAAGSGGARAAGPDNTVTVVDPSPVNWLSITWNTMEEANRVDFKGLQQPSLAESWEWADPKTLKLNLRKGVVFQDGQKFDAAAIKKAFDKVQSWKSPHPPGSFLNYDKDDQMEVVDDNTILFKMAKPDGAAFMKLRGMHVGSNAFWDKLGFVSPTKQSAEGNW